METHENTSQNHEAVRSLLAVIVSSALILGGFVQSAFRFMEMVPPEEFIISSGFEQYITSSALYLLVIVGLFTVWCLIGGFTALVILNYDFEG